MTRTNPARDLALVAVFAALIAVSTVWVPGFNVPGSSVPVTLQTMMIGLTAMILGPVRGFLATLLYLVVGFAGLPVFAGGASGIGVLSKPSAGYLVSFPIYALVVGFLSYAALRRFFGSAQWKALLALVVSGLIGSILIVHPFGIVGMARALHKPMAKMVKVDMLYWPGDIAKTIVAALVSIAVHKAFGWLALSEARPTRATAAPADALA